MFERILLPVDGSAPSMRAAEVAKELAAKTRASIVVMNVCEREVVYGGAFEREVPEQAAELVDGMVRELKDAGLDARGEVIPAVFGSAAREILRGANETGADVIVMGSRGLSDLAGLVLGSVAHKVIHLAHCPVLVVR